MNEDSFVAVPPLFLVADGMGGYAFGDRASQEAARFMASRIHGDAPTSASAVIDSIGACNLAVDQVLEGGFAGTTLTGLALVQLSGDRLAWMAFNLGSSRIYKLDAAGLSQLSIDHTEAQELADAGILVPESELQSAQRTVTRAVGTFGPLEPDIWLIPTDTWQVFVICSDGLTNEISDEQIESAIVGALPESSPADFLVQAALAAGGRDNVTVVVIEATTNYFDEPAIKGSPTAEATRN